MSLLMLIWWVSLGLFALSVVAWIWLYIMHLMTTRRMRRREQFQEEWMGRLLDWLESEGDQVELPKPRSAEEMEAVLLQIRDMAESLKGGYRTRLTEALDKIGARSFAIDQLDSAWATQRANAAALLNWCSVSDGMVEALEDALHDSNPIVRLEAAITLVRKKRLRKPAKVLKALCKDHAADSLVARDVFKIWGQQGEVDWSALFRLSWPPAGWVLLLEAVGASGNPEWTGLIAMKVNDPVEEIACAALEAMAALGYPDATPLIMRACGHESAKVRQHAALALRSCAVLDEARKSLLKLAVDSNFEVRKTALGCIIQMGGGNLLESRAPTDYWQEQLYREFGIRWEVAS